MSFFPIFVGALSDWDGVIFLTRSQHPVSTLGFSQLVGLIDDFQFVFGLSLPLWKRWAASAK